MGHEGRGIFVARNFNFEARSNRKIEQVKKMVKILDKGTNNDNYPQQEEKSDLYLSNREADHQNNLMYQPIYSTALKKK